ncbi:MAG: U32 family peptidase C-terminal domain-containing protein, partial [Sphaerochaetaceae bacterium]
HGAMCMAYSGRCLLSKYLTGRSANQGDCAHTCRWDYRLALEESQRPGMYMPIAESDGYTSILSSKDLCMIDHLADLKAAGVDSLKIEGRMKSLYYVAVTTRAYRKALDSLERGDDDYLKYRDEIFNVSHREFSTGFFFDSEAISSAAQGSYIRNYRFLGLISKEVQPGIWSLDIRNQIQSGLTLEYIGPDEFCIQDSDYQTLNENLEPVSHIDHCQVCYLKTGKRVKEGYIIRVQA